MFDLGIAKLGVIGIVALIVLGPTRLPQVARTVGALLGRAQRYLQSVQAEVSQQLDLDALQQVRNGLHDAAQTARQTWHATIYPSSDDAHAPPSGKPAPFDMGHCYPFSSSRPTRSLKRSYPPAFYRTSAAHPSRVIRYKRHIHSHAARAKKHAQQ